MAECANDKNKGFYNSIFWTFAFSSNVVGNLLAAFMTTCMDLSTLFTTLAILSGLSSILFLFLTKPTQEVLIEESQPRSDVESCDTNGTKRPGSALD